MILLLRPAAAASIALLAAALLVPARAGACGGGFVYENTAAPTTIGTQRALLELGEAEVSATFEIRGSGSAEGFVWVLPVPAFTGLVEAPADTFAVLDEATRPRVMIEEATGGGESDGGGCGCPGSDAVAGGGKGLQSGGAPAAEVIASGTVGPLAYDVIAPGDPAAMGAWLAAEGYAVPPGIGDLLQRYGAAGMSFIWATGRPGTSLDDLRPITVRWPRAAGAPLLYGLELARAGAAARVGVTLWIRAGSGRVEPGAPWAVGKVTDVVQRLSVSGGDYEPAFLETLAVLGPRAFVIEAGQEEEDGRYLTRLRSSIASEDLLDVPLVETGAKDWISPEQWASREPRRGTGSGGLALFALGAALFGAAGKRRALPGAGPPSR